MKIRFVVNPMAAAGRIQKQWGKIESLIKQKFGEGFEIVFTKKPMHAVELARDGIRNGCDRIIAVGGDGTLNEVINGFFENNQIIKKDVALGTLEIGTGADFIRNLNFPASLEDRIEYLSQASPVKIDIGLAEFVSFDGKPGKRFFLNILDFGIGGAVVDCVNRSSKMLGGKISFLIGIVKTLISYNNKVIDYTLDNGEWQTQRLNNFIVANGKYFGGGLKAAPDALINDGLFDIIFIGDINRPEAIQNLPRLRKGTHVKSSKVTVTHASSVEAKSDETVYIDMDGELVGILPIKVKILPQILPVLQ